MPAWALPILGHWSTKAIGIILALAILIGGPYLWGRRQYNIGYTKGYAKASEIPRNTYNGPTTVIQKTDCPPPNVFGLNLGKIGLGLIFK